MSEKLAPNETVGLTSQWTAAVRAMESQQPDCLFHDPWAAALAGLEGKAWIEQRTPASVVPIVIRTRYFDDFLRRIVAQEGIQQVILVGAGLDTRGFRLNWIPGTRIFELDQPQVLAHKEQILKAAGVQPQCARQTIGVDLNESWKEALLQSSFEPAARSLWLLEGLLFYLPNESIKRILDTVTALAAPGSWMGFDIVNHMTLTFPLTKPWVDMQAQAGAPWLGTMEDPAGYLAELGWQASLTQAGAEDAHYGRWLLPVIPVTAPGMPHNWYVTAQKVAE